MPQAFRGRIAMFEYQAPALLNQAAPVQNTWYTILDTTQYCRVYQISVGVEDVNETLEVRVTIDGEVLTDSVAAAHSTNYYAPALANAINQVDDLFVDNWANAGRYVSPFYFEGHSIKVEVRKTTAAGAGNLVGIVTYGILTDIP